MILNREIAIANFSNVAYSSFSFCLMVLSNFAVISTCHILIITFVSVFIFHLLGSLLLFLSLVQDILLLLLLLLIGSQSCLQSLLFHDPVVHKIKVKSLSHKCFSEHRNYLLVVRSFFKFQLPRIIEEVSKLLRLTCCQIIDASNGFLHLNLLILFFFCLCWQTLPR